MENFHMNDCCEKYSERVRKLEDEGLTTSDAQSVADVEHGKIHAKEWREANDAIFRNQ